MRFTWLLEDRIVNIKSFESQQPTNHLKEIGHVSNPGQKIPSAVFSCDSPLGLETKVKLRLLSCLLGENV